MKNLTNARKAQKPELVFTCREYTIEKIPLNYRINIKMKRISDKQGIERECYSSLKFGIEYAHETAKDMLEKYFTNKLQKNI